LETLMRCRTRDWTLQSNREDCMVDRPEVPR
jgi:hypothetical protein